MQCWSVVCIVTIQQMSIKKQNRMMIQKLNTYTGQLASKYCFVIKIWHSPYSKFMVRYNSWRVKIIWELFLDIRNESVRVMFLTNKKILTSLRWSNFGHFTYQTINQAQRSQLVPPADLLSKQMAGRQEIGLKDDFWTMVGQIAGTDGREWPLLQYVSEGAIVQQQNSPLTDTWPLTTCKQVSLA